MLNKIIKAAFLAVVLLGVNQRSFAAPSKDFMLLVNTGNPGTSAANQFRIPTLGPGYNYNVDCDNDGNDEITGINGDYICTYPARFGTYVVRISDNNGDDTGFPRIYFNDGGDKSKVIELLQWGTGKWTTMKFAFHGVDRMEVTAKDVPNLSHLTDLLGMFLGATLANPDTSSWNTSKVTTMNAMFSYATLANPDTSSWNTSKVTSMNAMFRGATSANPDTSNWNTSNVTYMSYMFDGAHSANPDVTKWDVSNVVSMEYMFSGTVSAVPNVRNWNTANVTDMKFMFSRATSANPDVATWDVSNVISMEYMFSGTVSAEPNVKNWNTANVTNMSSMFREAVSANPDVGSWNTANVTDMATMFHNAASANPDVSGWETSNVTNMIKMFEGTTSAIPEINNWSIARVVTPGMIDMFEGLTLPTTLYDSILSNFNGQGGAPNGVLFGGGNSQYCNVADRTALINLGWTIRDGGLDPNCDNNNDIIFKNSFEIPVTTFAATQKHFVFDFSLLENVKLDNNPYLIAIGLNSEQEQTIKVHVRKLEEQLQIRMSHLYDDELGDDELSDDEFNEDDWVLDDWQDIFNNKITSVSW